MEALLLIGIILTIFTVFVLLFSLWLWMLIECVRYEPEEGNGKLIWVLVIVLAGWIGALVYFFVRRPRRIAQR